METFLCCLETTLSKREELFESLRPGPGSFLSFYHPELFNLYISIETTPKPRVRRGQEKFSSSIGNVRKTTVIKTLCGSIDLNIPLKKSYNLE